MYYHDRLPDSELARYAAALNARARGLKRGGSVTAALLRGVILDSGGRCAWCGESLVGQSFEIDHVLPLSQGGPHTAANLVAACADCNRRKGDKLPLRFAQEQAARGSETALVARLLAESGAPGLRQQRLFGDEETTPSSTGWVYTPPEDKS